MEAVEGAFGCRRKVRLGRHWEGVELGIRTEKRRGREHGKELPQGHPANLNIKVQTRGAGICYTYIGQEMFVLVDIGCHGGSGWNMTKTGRPATRGKSHGSQWRCGGCSIGNRKCNKMGEARPVRSLIGMGFQGRGSLLILYLLFCWSLGQLVLALVAGMTRDGWRPNTGRSRHGTHPALH